MTKSPSQMVFKHRLLTLFMFASLLGFKVYAQSQIGSKAAQMKHSNVKTAYKEHWDGVKSSLANLKVKSEAYDVLIRGFKSEGKLDVWVKNKKESTYVFYKTFDICSSSGELGPKRREGDGQVPEGFYKIDLFNPTSNYYLSMRVNYPNASDRILSNKRSPGGAIMIHGNCVTIGCIPITDEKIKELYVLCLEASSLGNRVDADIFPCKLTSDNMKLLEKKFGDDAGLISFWKNLQEGFLAFESSKKRSKVSCDEKGKYLFVN